MIVLYIGRTLVLVAGDLPAAIAAASREAEALPDAARAGAEPRPCMLFDEPFRGLLLRAAEGRQRRRRETT